MDGKRLKALRKQKNLTQAELSLQLNVDTTLVGKWEIYNTTPSKETLRKLCELFNVSSDYLLGIDDNTSQFFISQSKNRIQKCRKTNGLSQQELADLLNLSRSTIAMYETGASEPDYLSISKMAKLFNVCTDYLMGITNYPTIDNHNVMIVYKNNQTIKYSLTDEQTKVFEDIIKLTKK